MSSPTSRTLERCRKSGWTAQVVEKWNPYAKIRQDLFEVIDVVVCIEPRFMLPPDAIVADNNTRETFIRTREPQILGIQACAMASRAARVDKCNASAKAQAWMSAGGKLEVWAWRKIKVKRGGKAVRWELEVTQIQPPLAAERNE